MTIGRIMFFVDGLVWCGAEGRCEIMGLDFNEERTLSYQNQYLYLQNSKYCDNLYTKI
jgi:hypothetical protein